LRSRLAVFTGRITGPLSLLSIYVRPPWVAAVHDHRSLPGWRQLVLVAVVFIFCWRAVPVADDLLGLWWRATVSRAAFAR